MSVHYLKSKTKTQCNKSWREVNQATYRKEEVTCKKCLSLLEAKEPKTRKEKENQKRLDLRKAKKEMHKLQDLYELKKEMDAEKDYEYTSRSTYGY